jgi:GNAT superfamily N-acetyltransferase
MKTRLVDGTRMEVNALLLGMQMETLPSDPTEDPAHGYWWLTTDGKKPAAYLGMLKVDSWANTGYIARVGVLHEYRGKGLQKHLLRVAERKARQIGWTKLISTTLENPPSANSFIACGYKTYDPAGPWGYTGTIYWLKEL